MTRLTRAWGALDPEQRIAGVAALALLLTMFLPWYQLQGLDRKSGVIHSHSISAFGDVSFVEAAIFLVAAGVLALLFARGERREFHLPGSDGTIVMIAGCWAALLIFYRVFSRPAGDGYPVGIQWGFFLAFIATGAVAYAGFRMRAAAAPEPPLLRRKAAHSPPPADEELTVVRPSSPGPRRTRPVAAHPAPPPSPPSAPSPGSVRSPVRDQPSPPPQTAAAQAKRPRYPPAPSDQLSFDDSEDDDKE
jgi:hypothetical protein